MTTMSPLRHPTQSFSSTAVHSHTLLSVSMFILSHSFPLTSRVNTALLLQSHTKNLDTPSDDTPYTGCNPVGQVNMVPGLDTYTARCVIPTLDPYTVTKYCYLGWVLFFLNQGAEPMSEYGDGLKRLSLSFVDLGP